MKPDEAIKTIESIKYVCRTLFPPKEQKALSLGIEALKFFKDLEDRGALPADVRLPGETEE